MSDAEYLKTNEFPEEWQVTTVGDEFDIQLGKMLDAQKNLGKLKPYLGNKHVQWRTLITNDLPRIPILDSEKERYLLRVGDLLVCEGGEVGRSALWQGQIAECYYQKALHRLRPKQGFSSRLLLEYLSYWASSNKLSNYVSQTSIAHLTREKFEQVPLPKPPSEEQEAIASALADVDALLESLEELLTKKRQLKQAAMQELLTGKTRLDGFTGEWEERRLGDLAEIRKGQVITERNARLGEIPVIAGGRTPAYFNALSNRPANCITVSASGAGAGYVAIHPYKIWASDCSTIEPSKDYEVIFLYWVLKMKQGQIYDLQSGGAQPHVQPHDLQPLVFSLPPLSEQKAIATILSEMDAELEVLAGRVTKTRQLKQGMMQELLTGRIRLI